MKLSNIIIFSLLIASSSAAIAKLDDLKQPVNISADASQGDIKKNQVVYSGNVLIIQGSIKITADDMSATKDKKTGNGQFIATGKPAKFSQVLDDGKLGIASATKIAYEQKTGDLVLSGDAHLDVGGIKMHANLIRYNVENQHVEAEGSANGKDKGRVQTIIPAETYQDSLNKKETSSKKSAEKKQ
ncbi:lipopolysaccharide transport periplasmic protein LptA [Shewanella sp. 202IG2-18]|uniref:lipopolysaccharide transport periplasmic protein LptA n=1 Tax=Parashewanella hymeniacidonis TaxID=2807618 RepID=UPI00195FAD9B|nr:lipopolysaccharide transport periplasmic protein LptA [Parashewanella hymeniacidonis]MBM7072256.1 lipopolysaccharide transport periplasmic protein LptA [Parashewanella hymeniacidonis]